LGFSFHYNMLVSFLHYNAEISTFVSSVGFIYMFDLVNYMIKINDEK